MLFVFLQASCTARVCALCSVAAAKSREEMQLRAFCPAEAELSSIQARIAHYAEQDDMVCYLAQVSHLSRLSDLLHGLGHAVCCVRTD